jgi:hypothetical protein
MNEITDSLVSYAKSESNNLNKLNKSKYNNKVFSHHYLLNSKTNNKNNNKKEYINSEIDKKIDKIDIIDDHFLNVNKDNKDNKDNKLIFKKNDDTKYIFKSKKMLSDIDDNDDNDDDNDSINIHLDRIEFSEKEDQDDDLSFVIDDYEEMDTSVMRTSNRVLKWVDDQIVSKCHECKKKFNMLVRKHHCRHCGRVFCGDCTNYKIKLLENIFYNLPEPPTNIFIQENMNSDVRVCKKCYGYIKKIYRIRKIIKIFELSRLNLRDLYLIGKINNEWHLASKYCIDKLIYIQNKLCIEKLNPNEKRIIWLNKNYLKSSPKWLTLLIRSVNLNDKDQLDELERIIHSNKIHSSNDNLCRSFSQNFISMNDILNLVRMNRNIPIISNLITKCFERIDDVEIILYIPFLMVNLKNNEYMYDIILDRCKNNFENIVRFYLNIKVFCDNSVLKKKILKDLFKNHLDEKFKKDMLNLMKHNQLDESKFKDTDIIIPLFPNIKFDRIDHPSIKIMDSCSRPMVIPFILNNKSKIVMYKKDDIRKDYLILMIIDIIHKILRDEEDMDIKTVRYKVQPTTSNSGYIEYVTNANTIYDIIHTKKMTIQNYILNHNHDITIKEFRERFMQSTALYCMISYLLGIGDRHLDNIMISEDGLLFHIDFGFILGQDPKYSNNKSIRITSEIIDVIGGLGSDDYEKFKSYCAKIYNRLRLHVNLFANLLSILPTIDPTITNDIIKKEIIERFEVGEYNIDAMEHMSNKVEKTNDMAYATIDEMYKFKKTPLMKSMKKGFSHASNFISNFL